MTLNYLGKYDNLSLLWEAHPNGGIEGEYCYVGDQLLVWDKYKNDWVEGSAEALDVIPSEQPERESNNGLNCIGCFESEQQLWSQHPQGGVEGDYVVIAGKEYIWDKYNKEWREATEEDAAYFAAAIVQDEAYGYSRLAITFMGSFEDVSQIWKVYPQGGIEGGYIYLGEDKYIWDKYSYSWKPFEPTESSKLRPIDVTYTEGVVAYSEDYINYIGTFDNLDQVWEMYPNGGKDGDYILVNGERLKWNKYTSNWGEDESGDTSPARSVATIYGDLHVFNDLVIGEGLYARILEELSKKQWVQDNFTTKQWLLDQNYARQEWVLDQYKVLQDWVDQRNADIAKWILERNYISEGDISSETVMNLIETDEITITKKDGVLVAIASGGQGSVPIITTKDVDAIPSDQNVFSAAKVVATFLDTTKGGTVHESVNFEKGIRIGGKDGIDIIYDIENKALCFGGNAYSLGGITAGGVGSGGSGGGGGTSYNRLDSWADYSADKAGYVLSAALGYDMNTRLTAVENAGYVTASALAPYALRSELDGYLSKSGGVVSGSITATSFIGNLTGTADNANELENIKASGFARHYYNIESDANDETGSVFSGGKLYGAQNWFHHYGPFITVGALAYKMQFNGWGNTLWYRAGDDSGLSNKKWREVAFADSNVASATKLATSRTIWGQIFNGTQDITGSITSHDHFNCDAPAQYTGQWARGFRFVGKTLICGLYAYGVSDSVKYLNLSAHGSYDDILGIRVYHNGNIAIGGATAGEKLHVYGNGKFTGSLTSSAVTTNSLTIGSVTLTYDSANNALCVNGNMYALGGVTAGGAGISTYSSLESRVARIEQQLNVS